MSEKNCGTCGDAVCASDNKEGDEVLGMFAIDDCWTSKWLQATKELLENDTRTVAEGKGWWWILTDRGTVGESIRGVMKFVSIGTESIHFSEKAFFIGSVYIQPAPAPPALEEDRWKKPLK